MVEVPMARVLNLCKLLMRKAERPCFELLSYVAMHHFLKSSLVLLISTINHFLNS